MEEPMILAEIVEGKKKTLRVAEVARILDVSIKKVYRMAAKGQIPSLKISNSIRFDPRYRSMVEMPIQYQSHSGSFAPQPHISEER
jgi:excisionase family DNA binding protein